MISTKVKVPAIASDIDGVIYSGDELRGSSDQVVGEILTKEWHDEKVKIPFVFLTNGGMCTEQEKAE